MRKAINIIALLFFTWLVLDTLNLPSQLLYFLLVGELPGTNTSLPPTAMLSLMTLAIAIILFEFGARRIEGIRQIRGQVITMLTRRERLPKRRFNRI